MIEEVIFEKLEKNIWEILCWAIMPNHYHFIANCSEGKTLPKLMQEIHGISAIRLNRLDNVSGSLRKVWLICWDVCLRNEKNI